MENNGAVLRIYPFLGITQSLLLNEEQTPLRFGAGCTNYAIQTDGYIVPYPAIWGMKSHYLGHINATNPLKLKKTFVKEPCTKCDIFNICSGRCLYANITKRWNPKAYSSVCDTVRNIISAITKELPRIGRIIEHGEVCLRDLEFMKFNGCEIIL